MIFDPYRTEMKPNTRLVRDIAFLLAGVLLGLLIAYVLAYHATLSVLENIQFGDFIVNINETEVVRAMTENAW